LSEHPEFILAKSKIKVMVRLEEVEAAQSLITSNPSQAINNYTQFLKETAGTLIVEGK
jgi:hypothetical protein